MGSLLHVFCPRSYTIIWVPFFTFFDWILVCWIVLLEQSCPICTFSFEVEFYVYKKISVRVLPYHYKIFINFSTRVGFRCRLFTAPLHYFFARCSFTINVNFKILFWFNHVDIVFACTNGHHFSVYFRFSLVFDTMFAPSYHFYYTFSSTNLRKF